MTASELGLRSSKDEWRAGWGVVLAATLGVAIASGHYHLFGVLLKPIETAYGWTRGQVSLGLTLITGIHIFANLVMGQLVDRFGPRTIALWGTLLFAIGMSLLGLAGPALWTWYATCAAFALLSSASSIVVWTTGIVRRFNRQRGLALAGALVGSGVTVAVVPWLALSLLQSVGLRSLFFVVGVGGGLMMFVLSWWFFRDEVGPALGTAGTHGAVRAHSVPAAALPGLTVMEAFRSRRYWQLLGSVLFVSVCISAFVVHLQPLLNESGMTPAAAATVAFFVGPSLVIGRLATGALFDMLDARLVAAVAFGMPAAACVLLLNLDGSSYTAAATAGIVAGLSIGAESDVLAYLTSRYFGLRRYGVLYAILVSSYGFGIGGGAGLLGRLHDSIGSYRPMLLWLALGALVAALLAATMGRQPRYELSAA